MRDPNLQSDKQWDASYRNVRTYIEKRRAAGAPALVETHSEEYFWLALQIPAARKGTLPYDRHRKLAALGDKVAVGFPKPKAPAQVWDGTFTGICAALATTGGIYKPKLLTKAQRKWVKEQLKQKHSEKRARKLEAIGLKPKRKKPKAKKKEPRQQ